MKGAVLILLLCLPLFTFAQGETLTNSDIIKLTRLDLAPSAIISKIRNSQTHFNVSVDALATLKSNGVNGDVISEMINAGSHEESQSAGQRDMNDPRTMRKEGIYYYNKSDPNNLFIRIDPTVVSNAKSGSFGTAVAQHYTYGISKSKQVSSLSGAASRRQIPHTRPKFYFYFSANSNISPNEFALVKLIEKKKTREMIVGASNAYGASIGINEKERVDVNYDQGADGIYRVYAVNALEPGEYCFIYTGSAPTMFSNDKVYDFGIPEAGN